MIPRLLGSSTLAAALGAAVVAGVFFAFSTFVMAALARLPAASGVAAMQSINVTVFSRWFMGALFGTAALALILAVASLGGTSRPGAWLRVAGSAFYLVGTIGVTIAFNVPRNESLARLDPTSAEAAALWPRFVSEWTTFNHVRTAAALVAALLLVLSLLQARESAWG